MRYLVEIGAWDIDEDGDSYPHDFRLVVEAGYAEQAVERAKEYVMSTGQVAGCSLRSVVICPLEFGDYVPAKEA